MRALVVLLALVPALALAQPLPPEMPPIGRTRTGPVLPPEAPIGRTRTEPVLPQSRPNGSAGEPIGSEEPPPPGDTPPIPEERPNPPEAADPEDPAEPPVEDAVPIPLEHPDRAGEEPLDPGDPDASAQDADEVPIPPAPPPSNGDTEASVPAGPSELGEVEAAACEAELDRLGVRFTRLDPLVEDACGAERPLMVAAVGAVELSTAATLRCPVALATARWVREVIVPAAALHLNATVAGLDVSASYTCRTRRTGVPTATLSEHAYANAIDIAAVRMDDGHRVAVMPREGSASPDRAFQAAIRGGACVLFTTVIGPTTNALHDDHLHLDLAERRGGGKICE